MDKWILNVFHVAMLAVMTRAVVWGPDNREAFVIIAYCVYMAYTNFSLKHPYNQAHIDRLETRLEMLEQDFKGVIKAAAETEKLARTMNLKEALKR